MEALKAIKIIGNQNDGIEGLCFYFMRDPKLAHILVSLMVDHYVQLGTCYFSLHLLY